MQHHAAKVDGGMQWLKWSSLRGTGALAQGSTGRDGTGSRGRVRTKHQNRMKALPGGPSEEVVFTDQQHCQTT